MLNPERLFKDDVILTWMRDRLLRSLISSPTTLIPHLKENMLKLNLNPYYTFPAIALLEPEIEYDGEHQRNIFAEKLRDFLLQHSLGNMTVFTDEEGRVGLLFSWVSRDLIESIQELIERHFTNAVTIGVGKPSSNLNEIHQSYEQASSALHNKFYHGVGQLIYYNGQADYVPLLEYPDELEKELLDTIKAADNESEIEQSVHQFYTSMINNGWIEIRTMYELTVRLLASMEKRVHADFRNANAYKRFEIMSVVKIKTLEQMKQYVTEFFIGLKDTMSPSHNETHRSIIKKSIHLMEQNCQDVSLQSVAQKVYMTPTYLSLQFKMNTGRTFIEHLTDIRIDKAKNMLKSTHYKNYEVAEQVGYQDPRYFSQIFKKKVGLSPSEYRESVMK